MAPRRSDEKSLILILASVVLLVGAGVLVYKIFFRQKHPVDPTMIAVQWAKVGYDRYGRPFMDMVKTSNPIGSKEQGKIGSESNISFNDYFIGSKIDIIARIDPDKFIYMHTGEFDPEDFDNPGCNSFNALKSILLDQVWSNIHTIGKPTDKIEINRNDYLLIWDSYSVSDYPGNKKALMQAGMDKSESTLMNSLKGYHEMSGDNEAIYRFKLFQAMKPVKTIVGYSFISSEGTIDKRSIEIVVR